MAYGFTIANWEQLLVNWIEMCNTSEAVLINLDQKRSVKIWIEIDNYVQRINDLNDLDKWFEKYNISEESRKQILGTQFRLDTYYVFNINNELKNIRISLI